MSDNVENNQGTDITTSEDISISVSSDAANTSDNSNQTEQRETELSEEQTETSSETQEIKESEGLLENFKEKIDETKGEKPDWLPENFWNEKEGKINIEGLSKSYKDLRKAFNDRNNDPSSDHLSDYMADKFFDEDGFYKHDNPDLKFSKDDEILREAFKTAQEAGMGIKQSHFFINKFLESIKDTLPPQITYDEEVKKLGKNGIHIIQGVKKWVDGLEDQGSINKEVKEELYKLGKTAAGVQALNVLRQRTGEQPLPTADVVSGSLLMSADDWYSATYETHGEAGESRAEYDQRMHEVAKKIFGTDRTGFTGSGLGMRNRA